MRGDPSSLWTLAAAILFIMMMRLFYNMHIIISIFRLEIRRIGFRKFERKQPTEKVLLLKNAHVVIEILKN